MSVAVGSALTAEGRAISIGGPYKLEIQSLSIVSGDVTATVTAKSLARVDFAIPCLGPVILTGLPTVATNVVSLAFTDPAASRFGYIMLFGK